MILAQFNKNKKAVLSQGTTRHAGHLNRKLAPNPVATQLIETSLKLSENMEKLLKNHCKRISEGLSHVAACHRGTTVPKFTTFGQLVSISQTPTLPNFVALRQNTCEISFVEKICSLEK